MATEVKLEMLDDIRCQTQLLATCLDLTLRVTPADRPSQQQVLGGLGDRHAIAFGKDIDGVLGHAPVGCELSAHNGDHAVDFLQHHMGARQIGRAGAS